MLELLSEHACFGGVQRFYRHAARATGLPMRFSVFLPPAAANADAARPGLSRPGQAWPGLSRPGQAWPGLFYLAGLTCNEETFAAKAGAQRVAAELGLMLVAPDTSPRGAAIAGEDAAWDFGLAAGFYLDATEAPWREHYRMYSYILELRELLVAELALDPARVGICGHSMGGHGALVLALRNPGLFRSLSAFAPIAAPSLCPWGQKAFAGYLGAERSAWASYDASLLMAGLHTPFPDGILIDQGLGDKFLAEQLHPEVFEAACRSAGQPLQLRRHAGYDHGYYFVASFIEDHLRFHARNLAAA